MLRNAKWLDGRVVESAVDRICEAINSDGAPVADHVKRLISVRIKELAGSFALAWVVYPPWHLVPVRVNDAYDRRIHDSIDKNVPKGNAVVVAIYSPLFMRNRDTERPEIVRAFVKIKAATAHR